MIFSILPTATPFSRNAIFSGLFPIEIAARHPDWWGDRDDESLNALAPLTELTQLNLEATNISNESADTLAGFKKLETLNISGTQIDDEGIRKIATLPNLKLLRLVNTGASYEIIDELNERDGLTVEDY